MQAESNYALSGLRCGSCVARVTAALQPYAADVKVSLDRTHVSLTGLHAEVTIETLKAAVSGAGTFELTEAKPAAATPVVQAQNDPALTSSAASWLATYYPLLLILAFILGSSVLVQLGHHTGPNASFASVSGSETMRYFMAGFFLVFAFFKLLDVRAFARAYASYDLLAARWPAWGLIYPFVELALGVAYLAHWNPRLTHWATIIIMGFSAIGVVRAVRRKSRIQCACLGTVFKLPMSTVTIVEDVGMVLMAGWMLFALPVR